MCYLFALFIDVDLKEASALKKSYHFEEWLSKDNL